MFHCYQLFIHPNQSPFIATWDYPDGIVPFQYSAGSPRTDDFQPHRATRPGPDQVGTAQRNHFDASPLSMAPVGWPENVDLHHETPNKDMDAVSGFDHYPTKRPQN